MRKWAKEAFSKKLILTVYIPGIILIILDRIVAEIWDVSIIVCAAQFLFNVLLEILIFRIPIWLLLAVALVVFIIYQIERRALDEKQKFILSIINGRDIELKTLALAYKKRWPKDSRIKIKNRLRVWPRNWKKYLSLPRYLWAKRIVFSVQ